MTTNITTDNNKERRGAILTGSILIVLGILGIALPNISTIVVETWIALLLASAGITKLIYAFQSRDRGGFIWKLLLSILYIATGLMLFVYPLTGVLTLTLLLGSFLLTEGTFELILAFRLREQPSWLWVLGNGIITLLLGALVWFQWPTNSPWLIGTLVGASVIVTGVSRIMLSLNAHNMQDGSEQAPSSV
jgi:uncharacterized membrane protein HdeD (DUF308 family)